MEVRFSMLEQQEYIGTYIGGYQLTAQLSAGSSSYTFLGETASLTDRQQVVVKWYHAVHFTTQQEKKDFLHEASALKRSQQPFILPILATGLFIDTPYIVTPYMSKGSLYNRIHDPAYKAWLQEHAFTIIRQIGQALAYSYQQNIAHGNLHTRNILFNECDEVQLVDFQLVSLPIATIETANAPVSTTIGQKPEYHLRAAGKLNDQRALGSIAYELLVGGKSPTNQRPHILCDSQDNGSSIADGEAHLTPASDIEDASIAVSCLNTYCSTEVFTFPTTSPLVVTSINRDTTYGLLPISQQKGTRGHIIRRLFTDQGSLFLLLGILCIIIFSIIGAQSATTPHTLSLQGHTAPSSASTAIVVPTAQPTSLHRASTSRLTYRATSTALYPRTASPTTVQYCRKIKTWSRSCVPFQRRSPVAPD